LCVVFYFFGLVWLVLFSFSFAFVFIYFAILRRAGSSSSFIFRGPFKRFIKFAKRAAERERERVRAGGRGSKAVGEPQTKPANGG